MPTILNVDGYRVLIYTRDHQPPHVHVWSAGCRAVIVLNYPAGPPSLRENLGFNLRQLRAIFNIVQRNVELLQEAWEKVHVQS